MTTPRPTGRVKALAGAALALALGGCASNYATQGPLTVHTPLPASYVAGCVEGLFNTRLPLVRRTPLLGGTLIKVMDLTDHTIAAVSVLSEEGGTRVAFVSDHADRGWYEYLFRQCVTTPIQR